MAITQYKINGEDGGVVATPYDTTTHYKHTEKPLTMSQRNFLYALYARGLLLFMAILSGISAQVAMFNDNMEKWFSRHLLMLVCIGFVGIISVIMSFHKE